MSRPLRIDLDADFCMECGKQSYPTQAAARAAIGGLRGAGLNRRRELPGDVYRCGTDRTRWHLARPPRQRRS